MPAAARTDPPSKAGCASGRGDKGLIPTKLRDGRAAERFVPSRRNFVQNPARFVRLLEGFDQYVAEASGRTIILAGAPRSRNAISLAPEDDPGGVSGNSLKSVVKERRSGARDALRFRRARGEMRTYVYISDRVAIFKTFVENISGESSPRHIGSSLNWRRSSKTLGANVRTFFGCNVPPFSPPRSSLAWNTVNLADPAS